MQPKGGVNSSAPLPPEPPRQEAEPELRPGWEQHGGDRGPRSTNPTPFAFDPLPYSFPDEATIPKREWLYRRHYVRGMVGATLGAPGRLKSTTSLTEAVSMAAGLDLLDGKKPLECGSLRVAYFNGEENQDELDRRVAAICKHYEIAREMCGGRLWVESTRDHPIRLATTLPRYGGAATDETVVTSLTTWCDNRQIDVLIIDPLVSFHRINENDNGHMDMLIKEGFGRIAGKTRSVDLVAHPRKLPAGEINTTIDDLRGASAQYGAIRTGRVFNFMTTTEAAGLGIEENQRRLYVRIEGGKGGPGPIAQARWMKIEVVPLCQGDDVAIAVSWSPPNHFANVTVLDMETAREVVKGGEYRVDVQSPKWLGWWLAKRLGLKAEYGQPNKTAEMATLKGILKRWRANNVLDVDTRPDERGNQRKIFVPGTWKPDTHRTGRDDYADF